MRHALLFSVFVIASCGLAYELVAGALAVGFKLAGESQWGAILATLAAALLGTLWSQWTRARSS